MQMAVLDQRNETVRASGISVAARHFPAGYRVDPAIVLATLQHDRCDELIDSHSRKHVASHFGPRLEGTMREGTGRRVESWFGPRAVLGALLLSAPACNLKSLIGDNPVQCRVERQECIEETLQNGQILCLAYSDLQRFTATACTRTSDGDRTRTCQRTFCDQQIGLNYGYMNCKADVDDTGGLGGFPDCVGQNCPGICRIDTSASDLLVTFQRDFRNCVLSEDGVACGTLDLAPPESGTVCRDASQKTLVEQFQPPMGTRDPRVTIITTVHSSSCVPPAQFPAGTQTYQLSSLGSVAGGGVSTAIPVARGTAIVTPACDPDQSPCPPALRSLNANVANLTVAGAQLSGVTISSLAPATIQGGTIPSGALRLLVAGLMNGTPTSLVVVNDAPLQIASSASALSLQGSISTLAVGPAGEALVVNTAVNVQGSPASAATRACLSFTPLQRLFGFEDPTTWTSSVASLSLATSPVTQGCGALGVSGSGFMPIAGTAFSTAGLTITPAVSLDLFIPGNQPNPSWLGATQMYLSCPSGNVFNQFIGQVELTGKPQNQYSTLRFPLPSAVRTTLLRGLTDCSFGLALNVNQTNRTWLLDNLRFTQ